MNLLDLLGSFRRCRLTLEISLECSYNLEVRYDKFLESIIEASLTSLLDEDCFIVPTLHPNLRPSPHPRLPLVKCSPNARVVPHQSNHWCPSWCRLLVIAWNACSTQQTVNVSTPSSNSDFFFNPPWFSDIEDNSQIYGASTYMHDMARPLSAWSVFLSMHFFFKTCSVSNRLTCYLFVPYVQKYSISSGTYPFSSYLAMSIAHENYPFSSPYMIRGIR